MRCFLKPRKTAPPALLEPLHSDVPELHDADIASVYYGQRMGGDFYEFLRVSPSRVLFGLLDVAGRRQDTRAILTAAQSTFRTLAPKLFAPEDINESDAMVELSLQLNRTIQKVAQGVRCCPAFIGCYHETLGTLCYSNAGHTPGLLRDLGGLTLLEATGLPLGLFSHATQDAPMVVLPPGAALLIVSRGIVEGRCNDEEFGLERVKEALQRATATNAKELCLGILHNVQEFMCTPPTHDDVTTLALVRAAAPKAVAVGTV